MVELKRVDPVVLAGLRAKLGDPNTALSAKYRILFSLRNIEGSEAHESILLGTLLSLGTETTCINEACDKEHKWSKLPK